MKKVFPLLAAALFIGQVDAHGLWTEQRRGNIETIYGHGAEDNAFKAEKISGAWAYDAPRQDDSRERTTPGGSRPPTAAEPAGRGCRGPG